MRHVPCTCVVNSPVQRTLVAPAAVSTFREKSSAPSMRSCSRALNAAVNASRAVLVELHAAVVLVVGHHEHADPAAEAPQRLDERLAPERAVLVLERRRERDRILDGRGLDDEAAVLVVLVRHRVRGDRVDHVRVLRLVEQAVDEARGVEAEVAADQPAARAVGQARAQQQLRRVERARRDDDRAGVDAPRALPSPSTYSTPRASPSSITTRSTRAPARSSSRPAAQASWM